MMQYSRKTYNKKKYIPYSKSNETYTYAFHDIDEHKYEILGQIAYWHVEDYRYVIPNNNIKPGEINIVMPDVCNGNTIKIYNTEYIVNNMEQFVNEFGVAMNPNDCNNFKYNTVKVESIPFY